MSSTGRPSLTRALDVRLERGVEEVHKKLLAAVNGVKQTD